MKFMKFESQAPSYDGPSNYLKVAENQPVVLVCRGEIYRYFALWSEGRSSVVMEGTPGAKMRFRMNAIIHENGKFVAKIWEFGRMIYDQLGDVNEVYPLEGIKIRVKRQGQGLETTYMIMPLVKPEDSLTPKQTSEINAVELNILDKNTPQKPAALAKDEDESWGRF